MKKHRRDSRLLTLLACACLVGLVAPQVFHTVQAQYKVVHLTKPVNTTGSETSALLLGDTVLVYASLPPETEGKGAFGMNYKKTNLYQARISRNGKMSRPKYDRWGFSTGKDHVGNLAIDPVNRDAYFTRGDIETLRCEIWWARGKKRRGWEKPVKLRGPVNNKQYTATHPAVGRLDDGTVVLYFVSDRPGGMGGMDIWQCTVKDGVASEPTNLGPQVNSADDEYTPFYDQPNGTLYFSSNRAGGKGGFDIYCAVGSRNTWQKAEPVCGCLNSEQNDLYFTISQRDSATGFPAGGHLSSNRQDSYFLNDSMCCYDIYRWSIDTALVLAQQQAREEAERRAAELALQEEERRKQERFDRLFPLYLYFHNDDPDPGSREGTTVADYADCQLRFALMRSQYMAHQHTATDSAAMQQFFDSCVVGNFNRVNEVLNHVDSALRAGRQVVLTVAGYASPVYHDDYNHILSQRRIGSFINMIRAWKQGLFASALADCRLRIEQEPMGIDEQSAYNPGLSDAIYSVEASRSRRIEVRSCKIF